MKKVEVLGPGCRRCRKLHQEAERAIAQAGVEAELVKVEDLEAILGYGVMMTPALVVDGEVKSSGRLPSTEQMIGWLRAPAGDD